MPNPNTSRTVFMLAHDGQEFDCIARAAADTPGANLEALPNNTPEDQAAASARFGDYGARFDFQAENWSSTAANVQRSGGHVVQLVVEKTDAGVGDNIAAFYTRLDQLKAEQTS